jgi:hypothetical protein
MNGEWESLKRENDLRRINRKNGVVSPLMNLTRGGAELQALWMHQLNSLGEVQMDPVQNANGSWPSIPGWDGPRS